MEKLVKSYENLDEEGWFDAGLPTTSGKQATANLLTVCGLHFDPIFDLSQITADPK